MHIKIASRRDLWGEMLQAGRDAEAQAQAELRPACAGRPARTAYFVQPA